MANPAPAEPTDEWAPPFDFWEPGEGVVYRKFLKREDRSTPFRPRVVAALLLNAPMAAALFVTPMFAMTVATLATILLGSLLHPWFRIGRYAHSGAIFHWLIAPVSMREILHDLETHFREAPRLSLMIWTALGGLHLIGENPMYLPLIIPYCALLYFVAIKVAAIAAGVGIHLGLGLGVRYYMLRGATRIYYPLLFIMFVPAIAAPLMLTSNWISARTDLLTILLAAIALMFSGVFWLWFMLSLFDSREIWNTRRRTRFVHLVYERIVGKNY